MVVCSSMLLKSIIILLGAAKQCVLFIYMFSGGPDDHFNKQSSKN
jgi:hypothetical protein